MLLKANTIQQIMDAAMNMHSSGSKAHTVLHRYAAIAIGITIPTDAAITRTNTCSMQIATNAILFSISLSSTLFFYLGIRIQCGNCDTNQSICNMHLYEEWICTALAYYHLHVAQEVNYTLHLARPSNSWMMLNTASIASSYPSILLPE